MKVATGSSLVILDELGRGTSTHDGTAIAYATLNHFVEEIRCFTLFVTHYPLIIELEEKHAVAVSNFHMSYIPVEDAESEFEKVVFLYQLERGRAAASYGLNVASLAGLPAPILRTAHRKSGQLAGEVARRVSVSGKGAKLRSLLRFLDSPRHQSQSLARALRNHVAAGVS